MWTIFWLNNSHFALELFAGLVFLMACWLSFSNYLFDRQKKMLFRSIGFFLLAIYQVIHGVGITSDIILAPILSINILGYLFVLISLLLEVPLKIPELSIVLILPSMTSISPWFYLVASLILVLIVIKAFLLYKKDKDKTIKKFFIAFLFFTIASGFSVYAISNPYTIFWITEHILKFIGAIFLVVWTWQYLQLRIKEELLLIFISMALFIGIIVTFTFSALFLSRTEYQTNEHLAAEVKVLDYALEKMKDQAQTSAAFIAHNEEIIKAVVLDDFATLEELSISDMKENKTDFLTISDSSGEVIIRAQATTKKGDNISSEIAGGQALDGNITSSVESTESEKLSIRGAAPLYQDEDLVGVIITGFIVDNNLVDKIKKITNLDTTIYDKDERVATTILDADGKSRSIGTKQTDQKVNKTVLDQGEGFVGRTTILSRPYLTAYMPIKNTDGNIAGMISVGEPQMEILQTVTITNQLTLFISIVVTLITIIPTYLISKSISRQVKMM